MEKDEKKLCLKKEHLSIKAEDIEIKEEETEAYDQSFTEDMLGHENLNHEWQSHQIKNEFVECLSVKEETSESSHYEATIEGDCRPGSEAQSDTDRNKSSAGEQQERTFASSANHVDMDPASFYAKTKTTRKVFIRPSPEESSESDISLSDDDADYIPPSTRQQFMDKEVSSDESIPDEQTQTLMEDITNHPNNFQRNKNRITTWRVVQDATEKETPKWLGTIPQADSIKSPFEYFSYFFYSDLLEHIVEQSNLFAIQKDLEMPLNLTKDELEQFIGTLIYITMFPLPRTRMFWAASSRVSQIVDIFSRTRWEKIKQNLHFNDNSNMLSVDNDNRDKLFKIWPLIDKLLPKFQAIPQNQMLSVDEQIVPFKGQSGLKQYIPNKPHKWGYKIFSATPVA